MKLQSKAQPIKISKNLDMMDVTNGDAVSEMDENHHDLDNDSFDQLDNDPNSMLDDGQSDDDAGNTSCDTDSESNTHFDNLMSEAMGDDVTAQLAAAGPIGMAAAAAIVSANKRKRLYSFETNPSIRKRQQNRLIRKLKITLDEISSRVGLQAVVLIATPGKPSSSYKVFGAKPLEDVVKNFQVSIMGELEEMLSKSAPPPIQEDPTLYELPPLIIDGIPTPVEKMTQAQLRAFIPLMLKYSTGRGKPGWGRNTTKPPWWPEDLPWANVRMDVRTDQQKQKASWTAALRQIVLNCYKFHGREDLLPAFTDDIKVEASTPPDLQNNSPTSSQSGADFNSVFQTISENGLSIIPLITLPDGTTAEVQGVATIQPAQDNITIGSFTTCNAQGEQLTLDLNNITEGTFSQEGQIILQGPDGRAYPVTVSGMISLPAVYENVSSLPIQSDTQTQSLPTVMKIQQTGNGSIKLDQLSTPQYVTISTNNEPQLLQLLTLKQEPIAQVQSEIKPDDVAN